MGNRDRDIDAYSRCIVGDGIDNLLSSECRGYLIGFFNRPSGTPIQSFPKFRSPDSYFWHPASLAYFLPRI